MRTGARYTASDGDPNLFDVALDEARSAVISANTAHGVLRRLVPAIAKMKLTVPPASSSGSVVRECRASAEHAKRSRLALDALISEHSQLSAYREILKLYAELADLGETDVPQDTSQQQTRVADEIVKIVAKKKETQKTLEAASATCARVLKELEDTWEAKWPGKWATFIQTIDEPEEGESEAKIRRTKAALNAEH